MTVRIVRLARPRPSDRGRDQPYEESLKYERAYQLEDRVIAVGPKDGVRIEGPRQFTRDHLIEVDFETLTPIPYERMVRELPGTIDSLSADDFEQSVERLV